MAKAENSSLIGALIDVRDGATTRKSARLVLWALLLRVDTRKGWKCWPSYETLCADTQLALETVQKAIRELELARLILRKPRHNHSNLFWVNAKLLAEQGEAARAAAAEKRKVAALDEEDPFANAGDQVAEDADFGDLAWEGPAPQSGDNDPAAIDGLLELLTECFPGHPNLSDLPKWGATLRNCLSNCLALAGSEPRCRSLIFNISCDDDRAKQVQKADKLGPYLLKCFPGWVAEFRVRLDQAFPDAGGSSSR